VEEMAPYYSFTTINRIMARGVAVQEALNTADSKGFFRDIVLTSKKLWSFAKARKFLILQVMQISCKLKLCR
jgi:hypothetical protein